MPCVRVHATVQLHSMFCNCSSTIVGISIIHRKAFTIPTPASTTDLIFAMKTYDVMITTLSLLHALLSTVHWILDRILH